MYSVKNPLVYMIPSTLQRTTVLHQILQTNDWLADEPNLAPTDGGRGTTNPLLILARKDGEFRILQEFLLLQSDFVDFSNGINKGKNVATAFAHLPII